MKKTGMLLPTMSQLPSLVYNFTAKPRTSRASSGEPLFPATVENRTNAGILSGSLEQIGASYIREGLVIFKESMGAKSACVNHTLRNPFMIEVEKLLAEMEILKYGRPALTDTQ
jgi:hypothetical protein